jgi:hypothetical protein
MQGDMMLHCKGIIPCVMCAAGLPVPGLTSVPVQKGGTLLLLFACPVCDTLQHLLCPMIQLCLPTCSLVSSKPFSFSSPISWLCNTSDLLADSRLDSSSSSCCCRN